MHLLLYTSDSSSSLLMFDFSLKKNYLRSYSITAFVDVLPFPSVSILGCESDRDFAKRDIRATGASGVRQGGSKDVFILPEYLDTV